jgi:hypothetical protein
VERVVRDDLLLIRHRAPQPRLLTTHPAGAFAFEPALGATVLVQRPSR